MPCGRAPCHAWRIYTTHPGLRRALHTVKGTPCGSMWVGMVGGWLVCGAWANMDARDAVMSCDPWPFPPAHVPKPARTSTPLSWKTHTTLPVHAMGRRAPSPAHPPPPMPQQHPHTRSLPSSPLATPAHGCGQPGLPLLPPITPAAAPGPATCCCPVRCQGPWVGQMAEGTPPPSSAGQALAACAARCRWCALWPQSRDRDRRRPAQQLPRAGGGGHRTRQRKARAPRQRPWPRARRSCHGLRPCQPGWQAKLKAPPTRAGGVWAWGRLPCGGAVVGCVRRNHSPLAGADGKRP